MKKLAYIFCIALFLVGCGRTHLLNVSYDPIDTPHQLFTSKIKRPVLYIDPVVDNREFALRAEKIYQSVRHGRFEEDPKIIYQGKKLVGGDIFFKTTKVPTEIIREALEKELRRFRVEITKDRNSADGVLKAFIEKFNLPKISTVPYPMINSTLMVEINLDLYQTGFENSLWNGTLKGTPNFSSKYYYMPAFRQGINTALNEAIKQWHSYPDFKEALVSLAGNVSSPPSSQQPPKAIENVYSGTGFLFSAKDYVITNWHVVRGTKNIKVKFLNGEKIKAEVALKDPQNDIAFLKLARQPQLPPSNLKIGDSSNMKMEQRDMKYRKRMGFLTE